jgi:hypothetical protein
MFRSIAAVLVLVTLCGDHATVASSPSPRRHDATAALVAKQDGAAVLWRDPGPIDQLDFADGPGGAQEKPRPPFQFVDEMLAGSTAKVRIDDSSGVRWIVKFGEEVRAQTFAARLAWSVGYFALPVHFVPSGTITGVTALKRAAKYVKPNGRFKDASFQIYVDSSVQWLGDTRSWSWNANPFLGTHQLNGLKVLLMLLSDWDNKDARDLKHGSNTAILVYPDGEARYLVTDWGGSMGTRGGYLTRSKWNCLGFASESHDFVKAVHGVLEWGYVGQHTDDFIGGIRLDDVRWLLMYLGCISDAQLRDGLLSSGATPAAANCFVAAFRERIAELQALR